ncbi:MAG: EipA family protein, partial [Hyphomicrobium sp.]
MKSTATLLTACLVSLMVQTPVARAAPCSQADFAAAVDTSGLSLRAFTLEAQPKLQERMRRYSEVKKLEPSGYEDAALDAIQDAKLLALDEKSADMLMRIDQLGRVADGAAPDCAKLEDIKNMSRILLAVMKEKSDYMLARLDAKIAEAGGSAIAAKPPAAEKPPPDRKTDHSEAAKPKTADTKPPAAKPGDNKQAGDAPVEAWQPKTKANDAFVPPVVVAQSPTAQTPPIASDEGYSIDEIRDATRGFFGTISTNLASVLEHAFKTTGRPTAYVLGTEGGGAFFAGLRFGQGTLFMRSISGTRPVYW